MKRVTVLKLSDVNTLVIQKELGDDFFITTKDSIIITTFNLSALLKFMLFREILSPKFLQTIVDDYMATKEH